MKILLISENKNSLELISRVTRNQFKDLEVVQAVNKDEAVNYASVDGPFGIFALDAEAKSYEPDELGKMLLDFTGDRPIIFFGHQAFINDRISQELYTSNEYNDRVISPYDRPDFKDDLSAKIGNALTFAKKEEFEQSIEEADSKDFIPMKIKSFYLYNSFPYDIYLEITPSRYIKLLQADKPYTVSTLASYAKKNVRFLHIRKDDQLAYLEGESKKCLKAIRRLPAKSEEMLLVLLRATTLTHQTLLSIGVTPGALTLCSAITDTIIEIVNHPKELSKVLANYPKVYAGIASKSLLTGFIATAMSAKMGWESETTKKKLTVASLLMDFTLSEEEMAKINSPADPLLKRLSEEQKLNYFEHPLKAAEISQQFTMYPDIDFLIENHHETPNRKGFPNKPSHTRLTALCSVFNIAQFLAAELDGNLATSQFLAKSLRALSRDYNSGNFKEGFKAAKSVFKV